MTEILIIVVVLIIIFFGGKKIASLAKSAGRVGGEFKKGKLEVEQELEEMKKEERTSL